MNFLRSLLWHLDTAHRARKARRESANETDLLAVATAVGVVRKPDVPLIPVRYVLAGIDDLSDYLKEQH